MCVCVCVYKLRNGNIVASRSFNCLSSFTFYRTRRCELNKRARRTVIKRGNNGAPNDETNRVLKSHIAELPAIAGRNAQAAGSGSVLVSRDANFSRQLLPITIVATRYSPARGKKNSVLWSFVDVTRGRA